MLDLSDTQAKLIRAFIENYRDDSGKISQGITQKGLKKYGLEPKTFGNHKDYFLKNYFIRPLTLVHHGNRNDLYYQITRLGVLAYLKWKINKNVEDIWLDRDFFPELFKYWTELVESFEQVLFDVLDRTIERIDVMPEIRLIIEGKKLFGEKLQESIIIPIGMINVKVFRKYKQPEIQDIPTTKDWGKKTIYHSLNQEIDDMITRRFTFLLFFNLLNLETDQIEFNNIIFQNYFRLVDIKKKSIKKMKNKSLKTFGEIHQRTIENTTKLFSIIKNDDVLLPLMKSSISEILDKLENAQSIKKIYAKLA